MSEREKKKTERKKRKKNGLIVTGKHPSEDSRVG